MFAHVSGQNQVDDLLPDNTKCVSINYVSNIQLLSVASAVCQSLHSQDYLLLSILPDAGSFELREVIRSDLFL